MYWMPKLCDECFSGPERYWPPGKAAGWTVLAGISDSVPDVPKERLLLVGTCTAKHKGKGIFVEGCMPNNRDIASVIVGEEQAGHWD